MKIFKNLKDRPGGLLRKNSLVMVNWLEQLIYCAILERNLSNSQVESFFFVICLVCLCYRVSVKRLLCGCGLIYIQFNSIPCLNLTVRALAN